MSVTSFETVGTREPLSHILRSISCQIIGTPVEQWRLFTFENLIQLGEFHNAKRN